MEARKNDADKLRFDLIPIGPLREVAKVYTIGSKKYEDRNWEKGLQWGRVYSALQRHATAWWGGEQYDPVDGQHHLSSVVWAALALMEYERTHPELDDRSKQPFYSKSVVEDLNKIYKECQYKQGTDSTDDDLANHHYLENYYNPTDPLIEEKEWPGSQYGGV